MLAGDRKNTVLSSMSTTGRVDNAYTAYGHRKDKPSDSSAIGFNGEFREVELDWYYLGNGNRIYNPVLMRFHSPDSYGQYGEAGFNVYAFCFGNPNDFTDPSGNVPVWLVKAGEWISNKFSNVFNASKAGQQTKVTTPENLLGGWDPIWKSESVKLGGVENSGTKSSGIKNSSVKNSGIKSGGVKSDTTKIVSGQNQPTRDRGNFKYIADGELDLTPRKPVTGPKQGDSLANPPSGFKQWKSRWKDSDSKNAAHSNWSRTEEDMASVRSHFVRATKNTVPAKK